MPPPQPFVLLSWVARNNDPYERERGGARYAREGQERIPGPTLSLLENTDSEWRGKIGDALLLRGDDERSKEVFEETREVLKRKVRNLNVEEAVCSTVEDPTDHKALFEWLSKQLPSWLRRFTGRRFVVHISPGTPAMQTAWLLLVETQWPGDKPIVVKSYRKRDRHGRPPVVRVDFALNTILGAHRATRLERPVAPEEAFRLPLEHAQSTRLRAVLERAHRFARLSVPILLQGERGTGKTTIASVIRSASPFRAKGDSWPTVACGQFSGGLIRAELFGHTKGAFTDATGERKGLLELLDGDTLFLDEVGDIDGDTQRMLVRALEEKKFQRLGESQDRESNFRLVTATNLPLNELAERLDADFFDRIAAFRVELPPLREIREDLPWLWEEVYSSALERSEADKQRCALADKDHARIVKALSRHELPGNIRDLLRLAWHLQAALTDEATMNDAVDFALESLDQPGLPARHRPAREGALPAGPTRETPALSEASQNPSRQLAEVFARDGDLRPLLQRLGGVVESRRFEAEFKAWLAEGLKDAARWKDVPVEKLCDVTRRSLNKWMAARAEEQTTTGKRAASSTSRAIR